MDLEKDINFLSKLIAKNQGESHRRKLTVLAHDVEAARSIVKISKSGNYEESAKLDAAAMRWIRAISVAMGSIVKGSEEDAAMLGELARRGAP